MDTMHDYVLRMSKDELPPALAFWSLTLYDLKDGFFIPNPQKKYSVGENAGVKLDAQGGVDIYVSATKPAGVPDENWLPINREDIGINGMFRIYSPDAEKMKTWKTPQFEMLPTTPVFGSFAGYGAKVEASGTGRGAIWPYVGNSVKIYRCPADASLVKSTSGPYSGQTVQRLRSNSMNNWVGMNGDQDAEAAGYWTWPGGQQFRKFRKMSDMIRPGPAMTWVLLDEHPDSINDGCFFNDPLLTPGGFTWTDLPANYHNGACGFSFADGHSEIKKWRNPNTKQPVRLTDFTALPCASSADYAWIIERTPRR